MRYDDDLDGLTEAVRHAGVTANMITFPGAPDGQVPIAEWPHEDWESFVGVASQLAIPVLYVSLQRLSEQRLESLQERFQEIHEDAPIWEEARSHLGRACVLEVAWMHGGVMHLWVAQAEWWDGLQRRLERENEQARLSERERVEQLARNVAYDPDMGRGSSAPPAQELVLRYDPHASEAVQRKAARWASEIHAREVKPRRDAAIAKEATELRRQGYNWNQIAQKCGISESKLKRIRQEHSIED